MDPLDYLEWTPRAIAEILAIEMAGIRAAMADKLSVRDQSYYAGRRQSLARIAGHITQDMPEPLVQEFLKLTTLLEK